MTFTESRRSRHYFAVGMGGGGGGGRGLGFGACEGTGAVVFAGELLRAGDEELLGREDPWPLPLFGEECERPERSG